MNIYNVSLREFIQLLLDDSVVVEGHAVNLWEFEIARHLGLKPEWNQGGTKEHPILVPHATNKNHYVNCPTYMKTKLSRMNAAVRLVEMYGHKE